MEKIIEFFSKTSTTVVGGIFLLASLLLSILKIEVPIYLDFAWITVIISGTPLIHYALWRIIHSKGIEKISSALLISIAMIASIAIGDVFAAGEIAFIMAIGEILEEKTCDRAKQGLKKLISLAPQSARIINGTQENIVDADKVTKGDTVRILPGEAIPVDGVIISGSSSVDQSVMTGESLPVDKQIGDEVFCGTINRFGAIDIKASKVGEDSSLQMLIRMVRQAEENKAPMQRMADKCASYLVPAALIIAIAAGLLKQNIVVAVTVLVVFCPCALVLATPTAIMAAIGQATKHGIIIKSGEALEKMGKADIVAFDKTGTLTCGKLEVSDIICIDKNINANELLKLVASAESLSEHPLGRAIVDFAKKKTVEICKCSDFDMQSGKGISAVVGGKKLLCGNEKYILENNVELSENAQAKLSALTLQGKASVICAEGGKIIGIIALCDILRENASDAIKNLSALGVKSVLLTGDNSQTAAYFAAQAGVDNVFAELLPENKVECIARLQKNSTKVCMIGDGVNDAPALKTADIGIAMGSMGSDIAVEAADIALMSDDISNIPYLKRLSNATIKTIRLSVSLSLFINFLSIILSVLQLLNPTTGALVHNAGSVFVVLIAAMLYERKFK